MSVKTITIDLEAYDLLAAEKKASESFSKVIKRHFSKGPTASSLLDKLHALRVEEDTLDRVEDLVKTRKDSVTDSPVL